MSGPAKRGELATLDALRGLSALGVLVSHVHVEGLREWSGAVFVDVFMAISGFLMCHHYILREEREPWGDPATVRNFYLRRFFRIAPLYYLCLAFFFVALPGEAADQATGVAWNVVQHVTFLFGFIPFPGGTGMPDWSIGLEMQFYLAFPFLMLAVRRWGMAPVLIGAAAVAWGANRLFGVYIHDTPGPLGLFQQPSFLPLKLTLFTFGMAAAYAYWKRLPRAWPWFAGMALVSALPYKHGHSWFVLGVMGLALSLCAAPATSAAARKLLGRIDRISGAPVFKVLAELSYGVYLLHGFVIGFVTRIPAFARADLSPGARWTVLFVATLAGAYLAAALAHVVVEKPGIALGHRLARRLRPA